MNTPRMLAEVILQPLSPTHTSMAIQAVPATGSPMSFTAAESGNLSIQGGTVSTATFARGGTSIVLGLVGGLIPLAAGDKVTINYLTAPTINFIPR